MVNDMDISTNRIFSDTHPNLNRDWVIGKFVDNSRFNTDKFEFKFQHEKKGHYREPKNVVVKNTRTLAILIYGEIRLKFPGETDSIYIQNEGEYINWAPDTPHEFEFMKDSLIITLRWDNV